MSNKGRYHNLRIKKTKNKDFFIFFLFVQQNLRQVDFSRLVNTIWLEYTVQCTTIWVTSLECLPLFLLVLATCPGQWSYSGWTIVWMPYWYWLPGQVSGHIHSGWTKVWMPYLCSYWYWLPAQVRWLLWLIFECATSVPVRAGQPPPGTGYLPRSVAT